MAPSFKLKKSSKALSPVEGEKPIVILRVQVLGCKDLIAMDSNGLSDPFVQVSVLGLKQQTPVAKKTLAPTYSPKDATFDFPLYLSLADRLGAVEVVVWDKDLVSKDYLGEAAIPVSDWLKSGALSFDDQGNAPLSVDLVSSRKGAPVTGTVQIKFGFVKTQDLMSFEDVYRQFLESNQSAVFASPTKGVGTRSESVDDAEDDGGISSDSSEEEEEEEPSATTKPTRKKSRKGADYNLDGAHDIVGIVMLEVQKAEDLPKRNNMTRTGWDMDPFVVISFGKKVFRTRVLRHSRNPVWEEKLFFHVRRYETGFSCLLQVLDWDKLSSNDYVGQTSFSIADIVQDAPQADPITGLYPPGGEEGGKLKESKLPLKLKDEKEAGKHNPSITFRAKYQPYSALRQQFWRKYLKQYDTDDTSTISHLELSSLLDSLESTLTPTTISSFFARFNKTAHEDELTFDEVVMCLEAEISRSTSDKRKLADEPESNVVLTAEDAKGREVALDDVELSRPVDDSAYERVINLQECPLCHRQGLEGKTDMDIATHLAVCASQDWNRVDNIVVGEFVTASQASKKWYTKVLTKVTSGDYKLGANSANIIVQNRMTGQLEEEKMAVFVRLGIRLLYKGANSQMEGAAARKLLKSLSVKQGVKYDDPESAKDIPDFIAFHKLDLDEVLDPLDSFKTYNEFFYRKLKPSARPLESPNDPYRLVSGADCRLMTFESVSEATRIWIKGREFSVARLLGEQYKSEMERYSGGALAIFRLAPQDYHRFHSPVEGKIGKMSFIEGEYYTVNPQAIRSVLDVYGENVRKIVPIDSPHFGRVMAVCVGAMMVGSITTTVEEGEYVQRGQEFGYFAFGGSTIVVLFEKDAVDWDADLLLNGRESVETLVRVGMGIGKGRPRDTTV